MNGRSLTTDLWGRIAAAARRRGASGFVRILLAMSLLSVSRLSAVAAPPASPAKPTGAKKEIGALDQARRANLRNLGYSLCLYLRYNEGKPPTRISELHAQGFVVDARSFLRPDSKEAIVDPERIDELAEYELLAKMSDQRPLLLVREKAGTGSGKSLAFYSDQSFRELEDSPAPTKTGVVPYVAGRSAAEAKAALLAAGLTPKFRVGEPAPSRDLAQRVYRLQPAAGEKLSKGAEVLVWLHARWSDSSIPPGGNGDGDNNPQLVEVPNVIGLSIADAKAAIVKAGFKPTFVVGDQSSKQGRAVYHSEPAPGSKLPRGATVKLTIHSKTAR